MDSGFVNIGFLEAWNKHSLLLDKLAIWYNISTDDFKIVDIYNRDLKLTYLYKYYGDFLSNSSVYRVIVDKNILSYKKTYNRDLKLNQLL